jgi:hypothetical protein
MMADIPCCGVSPGNHLRNRMEPGTIDAPQHGRHVCAASWHASAPSRCCRPSGRPPTVPCSWANNPPQPWTGSTRPSVAPRPPRQRGTPDQPGTGRRSQRRGDRRAAPVGGPGREGPCLPSTVPADGGRGPAGDARPPGARAARIPASHGRPSWRNGEILGGRALRASSLNKVLSSRFARNELMRLCLLRWQDERHLPTFQRC